MREIPLTQGKVAMVDDEDYSLLSRSKWYVNNTQDGQGYPRNGNIIMVKLIMGIRKGNLDIGYKDGNTLNLQKDNLFLRVAGAHQGTPQEHKTSQYCGVCWASKIKKWMAQTSLKGKHYYLGIYDDEKEAAMAYNKKALELFGDHARLNKIEAQER